MAAKKKGGEGKIAKRASAAGHGGKDGKGGKGGKGAASRTGASRRGGRNAAPAPRSDRRESDVSDAVYVASSSIHGAGMFAAAPIAADVSLGRLAGMPTHDDGIHVLWLNDELGLEVTNDFRFINHDKDPNCELTDVDVVTLRAIAVDEELTHDYGW